MALRTTVAEADWKQPSEPTDTCVVGIQLIREVTEVDATQDASIMASLNATPTVTNPKCDGVTYTGTYYISDMESIAQEGGDHPGSVTIRQKLTKIWTIATQADLPTKIDMRGQDIVDAFYLEALTEDIIAYEWLYLNPANVAVIEAMTVTVPAGYKEIRRRTDIEGKGDRTCSLRILYKKVTYPNTLRAIKTLAGATSAASAPTYSWETQESGANSIAKAGNRLNYIAPGVDVQNVTAITQLMNNEPLTSTPSAADSSVVVVAVNSRMGQDGEVTIEQELAKVNTDVGNGIRGYAATFATPLVPATTGSFLLEVGNNSEGTSTHLRRWWPSITVANAVVLCTTGGYAVSSVTMAMNGVTNTYAHRQATIQYDMATGLCNVIQDCGDGTDGLSWWKHTGHTEVFEHHLDTFFAGSTPEVWNVLTQQLLTASETSSLAFMNCTTPYNNLTNADSQVWTDVCPDADQPHRRGTRQYRQDDVYDCRRVLFYKATTQVKAPAI